MRMRPTLKDFFFFFFSRRAGAPEVPARRVRERNPGSVEAVREGRGAMLSPDAERVMQYLVEVEELAEAVLSDKQQVRAAAAGAPSAGARVAGRWPGLQRGRSGWPGAERVPVQGWAFLHPALLAPRTLTLCGRLPRQRFPNAVTSPMMNELLRPGRHMPL